jgi:hypothetical protein
MTSQTTYFLGAGASANAIPVVKSMNLRLKLFQGIFEKILLKIGEQGRYQFGDLEFERNNFQSLLQAVRSIM